MPKRAQAERLLVAAALAKSWAVILVLVATRTAPPGNHRYPGWIFLIGFIAFLAVGSGLVFRGREERGRLLGAVFVFIAAAYATGLLGEAPDESSLGAIGRGWRPFRSTPFLAYFFIRFLELFPEVTGFAPGWRALRWLRRLSFVTAVFLLAANVTPASALPGRARAGSRSSTPYRATVCSAR